MNFTMSLLPGSASHAVRRHLYNMVEACGRASQPLLRWISDTYLRLIPVKYNLRPASLLSHAEKENCRSQLESRFRGTWGRSGRCSYALTHRGPGRDHEHSTGTTLFDDSNPNDGYPVNIERSSSEYPGIGNCHNVGPGHDGNPDYLRWSARNLQCHDK